MERYTIATYHGIGTEYILDTDGYNYGLHVASGPTFKTITTEYVPDDAHANIRVQRRLAEHMMELALAEVLAETA